MNEQEHSADIDLGDFEGLVVQMLDDSESDEAIVSALVSKGLTEKSALLVIERVAAYWPIKNAAGKRNMKIGSLSLLAGIIITFFTYNYAGNGGTYVVTWGAIVIGGIQFLIGLFQTLASRD